ncbi:hypothetical protein LCGC14_2166480, partial [marine sediment metagenome]
MSGDWIKMRKNLRSDPDVIAMATFLGIEIELAIGKLHTFWSWVDDHSTKGRLPGVTTEMIDAQVAQERFSDSLVLIGWLRVTPLPIAIPNFDRYLSEGAKVRALATERKRRQRIRDRSRTDRDTSVTRGEEKRKEEKREEKNTETPLPPLLDTEEFRKLWKRWTQHRKEIKA